jgi:hypothetical protein
METIHFADMEGLCGHGNSVRRRLPKKELKYSPDKISLTYKTIFLILSSCKSKFLSVGRQIRHTSNIPSRRRSKMMNYGNKMALLVFKEREQQ